MSSAVLARTAPPQIFDPPQLLPVRPMSNTYSAVVIGGDQLPAVWRGMDRVPNFVIPAKTWMSDWIEFQEYADDWKKNRPKSSRAAQLAEHPSYRRIIGMGPERAVPCILRELRDELRVGAPYHWFWALWELTRENPVPEDARGNISKMARAWIAWGEKTGYIDAEGVGGTVPATRG
jgi:hypothetical protein